VEQNLDTISKFSNTKIDEVGKIPIDTKHHEKYKIILMELYKAHVIHEAKTKQLYIMKQM